MAFEILVTGTAESDFNEAISHIAVYLKNPTAAGALADEYEKVLMQLSDNPYIFHHFRDSDGNKTAYRRCNIKNYSVFFRIDGNRFIICRFLYAWRNLYSVSMEIEKT